MGSPEDRDELGPIIPIQQEKMEGPQRNGAVHPRSDLREQKQVNQILNPVEGFSKSFWEQVGWQTRDPDLPGGA